MRKPRFHRVECQCNRCDEYYTWAGQKARELCRESNRRSRQEARQVAMRWLVPRLLLAIALLILVLLLPAPAEAKGGPTRATFCGSVRLLTVTAARGRLRGLSRDVVDQAVDEMRTPQGRAVASWAVAFAYDINDDQGVGPEKLGAIAYDACTAQGLDEP